MFLLWLQTYVVRRNTEVHGKFHKHKISQTLEFNQSYQMISFFQKVAEDILVDLYCNIMW